MFSWIKIRSELRFNIFVIVHAFWIQKWFLSVINTFVIPRWILKWGCLIKQRDPKQNWAEAEHDIMWVSRNIADELNASATHLQGYSQFNTVWKMIYGNDLKVSICFSLNGGRKREKGTGPAHSKLMRFWPSKSRIT